MARFLCVLGELRVSSIAMPNAEFSEDAGNCGISMSSIRPFRMGASGSYLLIFIGLAMSTGCGDRNSIPPRAEYVGKAGCIACHQDQNELFSGSHHDLAMQVATEETVLGDFDNSEFTYFGITTRFIKKNGKFYAYAEGPGGELDDYEIIYTFGIEPLQQYLVEFPGGKLQCLPICWDTRPANEGGQRWFHLYPEERIKPNDILFWTRTTQNWNAMCAECHSTNLRKNYDRSNHSYDTRWSEIDVSCEACHGPGSRHVEWATASDESVEKTAIEKGLVYSLEDSRTRQWLMNSQTGNSVLINSDEIHTQVDMCGRCHSHRSVISEDYIHGKPLANTHQVSLLDESLYFPDGQIKEEVYVYGSFLQSKMFRAGVICSDCHDPHSSRLVLNEDKLCFQCHLPQKYGTIKHHIHNLSTGIKCVDCHMPKRTYMVIDDRRDHSFRVPRPDLSETLQSPNACNQCHDDKSKKWAAESFFKRYPDRVNQEHFGQILNAATKSDPNAATALQSLALNREASVIVRATAARLLGNYPGRIRLETLQKLIQEKEPLIRAASVEGLFSIRPEERVAMLIHILNDSNPSVRAASARSLISIGVSNLTAKEVSALEEAQLDFERIQSINGDFPSAILNLANLYIGRGEFQRAEVEFRDAIKLEPAFLPSYVNLADLFRLSNNDEEGRKTLLQAFNLSPNDPSVNHALGLLYIRIGDKEKGMEHLALAAMDSSNNPRYKYVYGVALDSEGRQEQAIQVLEEALQANPFDRSILEALVSISKKAGMLNKAKKYQGRFGRLFTKDTE